MHIPGHIIFLLLGQLAFTVAVSSTARGLDERNAGEHPSIAARDVEDDASKCSKTSDGTCMYDKDGNVDIGFADKTMNWGTLAPVAMIRVAYDKCSKFAGACDGSASKMPTTVVQGDKAFGPSEDGTVTCNYVGNFKGKYKNHMVDALDGAVHKTTEVKHIPDSGGEGYDQHRHSDKFAVKIPSQGSSILITCTIDISKPDEGDFCSTFFDIAGDVAGAVKGVKGKIAGAAFKLLSLVCNPS